MDTVNDFLVKSGLRTVILVSETGMSRKQITAIRRRLGLRGSADSGPLPHSENILGSRAMSLEASLFMQAYLLIAANPRAEIDILSVISAHSHYLECHAAIRSGKVDLDHFLELDKAWVLARDFRGYGVVMRNCDSCHIDFVASINARRHSCPICSGVTVETPDDCDEDRSTLSLEDLISKVDGVRKSVNWGITDQEICEEYNLTASELAVTKQLSQLSAKEIKALTEKASGTAEIIDFIREHGNLKTLVA